jgi:hypothetical protein
MTKVAIKIYSIASVVIFTLLLLLLFTKIRKRWYAIKLYLDIEITTIGNICHKNAALHLLLSLLCCCCCYSLKVEKGGMQLKCISTFKLQQMTLFSTKNATLHLL